MRTILRSGLTAIAVAVSGGCAEGASNPASPAVLPPKGPRSSTTAASEVWNLADVDAAFGVGMYSLDSTQIGNSATTYFAPDLTADEAPSFCRDHFNAIDLWWDGGHGIASFHLDPPLLFVGYRPGNFTTGVLTFRRAVYETLQSSEATDPAGNVWRFQGRFNALCRGGEFEIGPIVFGGQIVRSQDPIDKPVLVRSACNDGPTPFAAFAEYDPYDSGGSGGNCSDDGAGGEGSGTQYSPGDHTGGETVDWNTGVGDGGSSACGQLAVVEYICIDTWNGSEWKQWSCGYATTC